VKKKKKRKAKPPAEIKPQKTRRLPLEQPVKGVLMNYQRGTVRQRPQYGLIQLEGVTSIAQAAPYIGRSVILHFNEQKSNQGRIISVHGRNGVLRARFRRSLAADAIAKEVLVY
jgi:large subunit ribosomal protein L35Ae